MDVVGYLRVSTIGQKAVGMSIAAQRAAIEALCAERGWTVIGWYQEARSASRSRPELEAARVRARELHGAVLVARFDRAWRHPLEFYLDLDRAKREGWAFVLLSPRVDLTDPFGEAMAGVAAVFARFEQQLISLRTRDAIQARREAGIYRGGSMLERCRPASGPGVERVLQLAEREPGMSAREIARRMNVEGWEPPRGRQWWHGTVSSILRRARSSM